MLGLNVRDADHPQLWGSLSSEYLHCSALTNAGVCNTWNKACAVWIVFSYCFVLSYFLKGRRDWVVRCRGLHSHLNLGLRALKRWHTLNQCSFKNLRLWFGAWHKCDVIPGVPLVLLTAEWWLLRALHLNPEAGSHSSPQPAMQVFRGVFPYNVYCSAVRSSKGEYFQLFASFWAWGYDCFWMKRVLGHH